MKPDPSGRWRGTLADGEVRAMAVDTRRVAAHAATLHGLDPTAAALQADALAATALLGAYLDDGERLTLQLQLQSPRMAFTADIHADGTLRCRTTPASLRRMPGPLRGVMLVMKSFDGREVYRGATEVEHAGLDGMLQAHLDRSAQVDARVRVRDGRGAFVERMPGADPSLDLEALLDETWDQVGEEPLTWGCTCSRERVLGMLSALPTDELQAMIDEDGGAVVTCNFCTARTELDVAALRSLLPM